MTWPGLTNTSSTTLKWWRTCDSFVCCERLLRSRNYLSGNAWLPVMIVQITGSLYRVRLTTFDHEVRRHTDQLKSTTPHPPEDLVCQFFSTFAPQHRNVANYAEYNWQHHLVRISTVVAPPVSIVHPPVINDTVPSTSSPAATTSAHRVRFAKQLSSLVYRTNTDSTCNIFFCCATF